MSDIGVDTSVEIIGRLRNRIKKEKIESEEDVKNALREEMKKILDEEENGLDLSKKPTVILVVGVNGVGKTTSIGKMANRIKKEGKSVIIAAADTFRAAAVEQVEIWAKRSGSKIVKRDEGTDPASVVFEAIQELKKDNADVLICDTAGRLHNKKYLMDELNKIQKVINKEMPESDKEVLLVIDGTTGQNAIQQVKAFKQEADITGLVLTKLDGTAKGGVVIGIVNENSIPVKFVGVGEKIDDMEVFNSKDSCSCAKRSHKKSWKRRRDKNGKPILHCGFCLPCIYRRVALDAVGWGKKEPVGVNVFNVNEIGLSNPEIRKSRDFKALLYFLRKRYNRDTIEGELIANGVYEKQELEEYATFLLNSYNQVKVWVGKYGNEQIKRLAGI